MSRQDANAAFAATSFLYGGNAGYIDDLYARYEADPNAVDGEWQVFFRSLKDDPAAVLENASGPSWALPNWPQLPRDDLTRALAADWGEVERAVGDKLKAKAQSRGVEISAAEVQQATRDSIHALMLIRAYRIRGAFHANLDPLGLEPPKDRLRARSALLRLRAKPTTTGRFSSTACSVSSSAPSARSSPSCSALTARPWRWSSCTSPTPRRKAGCRSASRAPTRRSASPARASAPSSTS